jgi:predicted  nucleic acid-binding Zn-ribbon protein
LEALPPARAHSERIERAIESKKQEIEMRQKAALEERDRLQAEYASLNQRRPEAVARLSGEWLARYDGVRKKTDGTAMALVQGKTSCAACGTILPTRTIVLAREGKWTPCEGCGRALYWVDGVAV